MTTGREIRPTVHLEVLEVYVGLDVHDAVP